MTEPARRVSTIARLIEIDEPVLIAAHGRDYHDPYVLARSWAGATAWLETPRCRAHVAGRWLAVDRAFAELLDRHPCQACARLAPKITDADEAPEPDPGPRVTTTEGTP